MATCKKYTVNILNSENIGDSLIKINNNFINLQTALCSLQKKINDTVKVRTFFYYGPNSVSDATSGMRDGEASRPSNATIQLFVNSSTQLNVPAVSKVKDVVYVIYQKTGYVTTQATRVTTGTTTANVISFSTVVPWSTTSPDIYTTYSPVFIIWRLTFDGTNYVVDKDFPKFSQAETLSTEDWNQPQNWLQY
jgi:hypothetical protein